MALMEEQNKDTDIQVLFKDQNVWVDAGYIRDATLSLASSSPTYMSAFKVQVQGWIGFFDRRALRIFHDAYLMDVSLTLSLQIPEIGTFEGEFHPRSVSPYSHQGQEELFSILLSSSTVAEFEIEDRREGEELENE